MRPASCQTISCFGADDYRSASSSTYENTASPRRQVDGTGDCVGLGRFRRSGHCPRAPRSPSSRVGGRAIGADRPVGMDRRMAHHRRLRGEPASGIDWRLGSSLGGPAPGVLLASPGCSTTAAGGWSPGGSGTGAASALTRSSVSAARSSEGWTCRPSAHVRGRSCCRPAARKGWGCVLWRWPRRVCPRGQPPRGHPGHRAAGAQRTARSARRRGGSH